MLSNVTSYIYTIKEAKVQKCEDKAYVSNYI